MPNILFILADDMGEWAMGCSGNKEVITPNIDELARNGVRFENFFCTSPVCSPARASILTGQMPSVHGISDWLRVGNLDPAKLGERWRDSGYKTEFACEYLAPYTAYTDVLAANGYDCALSGKWHLGNSQRPQKGFSRQKIIAQGGCNYYGSPLLNEDGDIYINEGYLTETITDNAIAYLDEMTASDRPFYLSVHYTAPHTPWNRDQHPARVWDMYDGCPFESVEYVPPHVNQAQTCQIGRTAEERATLLRGYYTAITAMDENIGRMMTYLRDKNLFDDTLIVFMGDNGMNLGQHGIWGKGNGTLPLNMYDSSIKVPLIISRPTAYKGDRVCSSMYSQYDFLPTLLDCCGYEAPENIPGISFKNELTGEGSRGRNAVYCDYAEYGPVRMIRGEKWKYVRRWSYADTIGFDALPDNLKEACLRGGDELYDLENDPDERVNLVGDERYAAIIGEYRAKMDEWFDKYASGKNDARRYAVTGFGQTWKN